MYLNILFILLPLDESTVSVLWCKDNAFFENCKIFLQKL